MINFNFKDYYVKGQEVYYLRVIQRTGTKEVLDCIVGNVEETVMFICDSESKRRYMIKENQKDYIYINRKEAAKDFKKIKVDKVNEEGE